MFLLAVAPLFLLLVFIDLVILKLQRRQRRHGLIEFHRAPLRQRMRDGWHRGRV